jgi:endonuclease/exonuclease/phosphatase family metal-dependent hydrolase
MDNFVPRIQRSVLYLTALAILLGAQSIRVLLPSSVWYLGATLGMNIWLVVLFGYGTFALALAVPLLVKWLKPRGALWVAGVGLMLSRLVEQVSTMPALDVGAAIGGVVCFLWLLPLLFGRAKADGESGLQAFALGFLLGLSLDTALRGLTGTLDLSWIPGLWPVLTMIVLVGVFGYTLWHVARGEGTLVDGDFLASLTLIGPGLLLFFQWLILQNQGWVATLTGWSPGAALSWITLGNAGALLVATYALRNFWLRSTGWWLLLPGGALTLALVCAAVPGWIFAFGVLVGLVSAGVLLSRLVIQAQQPVSRASIKRVGFAFGLGSLLFYTLITLYYASFLAPVQFPRSALASLAGIGLTMCAVVAARQRLAQLVRQPPNWIPALGGALLLLVSLGVLLFDAWHTPRPSLPKGYPVRVMTYNIRAAYGLDGRQDIEAVARVIEGAGTEIVALQEISRGWLLDGSTDLLPLLSRQLNMPYTTMGASADPIGGIAILSRYPILATGQGDLPRLDTLVGRGYLWAQIDLGAGETLLVFTTHLHHEPERNDVRMAQVEAMLNAWNGQPQVVLLGDMNAIPGSPEMQMILDAGFVDTWAEAGHGEVNTSFGGHPNWRIDWILHTPDLVARDVEVIESRASDHSAVVATIARKP